MNRQLKVVHGPGGTPSRKGCSPGFTLLEVLVSLAIVALVLVVLLGLRNRDVQYLTMARQMTMATALAKMKMVEAQVESFPELGEMSGAFDPSHSDFRWHRMISPTPFDYVREVRISVLWGQGGADSVVLVHYVFDDED